VGGSIAFYYQHPEYRTLQKSGMGLSNRMRERLSLIILTLIAQHYYHHKPSWNLDSLSKKLHLGVETTHILITDLLKADLIVPTSVVPTTYMPAHALETMKLVDIIMAIRQSGEKFVLPSDNLPEVSGVEHLFSEMESAMHSVLADRSLRDLAMDKLVEAP
jgi:DNA-binding IscR family transcriptional regulator